MKKTSKTASSPAPATRTASPKKAPLTKAATPPVTKTAPKPLAKSRTAPTAAPASVTAPRATPAPAAVTPSRATPAPVPNLTVITARVDVGFGNTLYIRGEGPGLSWSEGLPLKNLGVEEWTISLPRAARPVLFKFLINDDTWSAGKDFSSDPGMSVTITPTF